MKKPKIRKNVIYQRNQGGGKDHGEPSDVEPGDVVVFFLDGAYTTREADFRHGKTVVTKPLYPDEEDYRRAPALVVKFDNVVQVIRTKQNPVMSRVKPKPEPEVEPLLEEVEEPPPEEPLPEPEPPKVVKKVAGKVRLPGRALRPGDPGYSR
jgi:hypothetical protein